MILSIDGVDYTDRCFVNKMTEIARIVDKAKGTKTQSGKLRRKITGTEYTYQIEIVRDTDKPSALWDEFFDVLSAPVDFHDFKLPHNDTTISFRGAVEEVTRDAENDYEEEGVEWGDVISLIVTPEEPQRRVT